jgi:hypothetical protein
MSGSRAIAAQMPARVAELWHDRRLRLVATAAALGYLAVRWLLLLVGDDPILGADAFTYWSAPYDNPYPGPQLGLPGAYLYPPPFIQALAPLRLLPWEAFHAIWAALGFGALVFLVGPIGGALAITLLPFVYRDLLVGNIHLMLGASIVVGLSAPMVWVFPILTKITPGIGVLWFAARAEWRRLAWAVGAAVAVAVVSFAIGPDLWFAWLDRMRGDTSTAGSGYLAILLVRMGVAALLVAVAARTGRGWLVPIAVVISLPILWPDSLAILLACFPLIAADIRTRASRGALPRG